MFVDGKPRWTDPGQLLLQPRSAHLSANPVIDVDGRAATAETEFAVLQREETVGRGWPWSAGTATGCGRTTKGSWVFVQRTGVSLARPGEAGTDSEWQRALARTGETVDQEVSHGTES